MTMDVGQSCYGWSLEDLADQDDSQKLSLSQMLEHGSISFGRFALEPLSWEKRSVFTHNRYQEELEKFRAPGLVAQKKAYFEERYKRIRAMKASEEYQHAESVSCCSEGSGKLEKTVEKDLRAVPNESRGDEFENAVDACIGEVSTETNLNVDGESALVELDLSAKLWKYDIKGEKSRKSMQSQLLDINSHDDKHVDSEHDDFITLGNEQEPWRRSILGQTGEENQRAVSNVVGGVELKNTVGACPKRASTEVTLEIGFETALPGTDLPTTSSKDDKMAEKPHYHECITACIKDSKQPDFRSHDNKVIIKKSEDQVQCASVFPASLPNVSEIMLEVEPNKVNPFVKACVEHTSPAGGFCMPEYKTKPFSFMSMQTVRDPSKRSGKNNVGVVSCKRTVDRMLCSKHASAVSHGSPKEMRSKITAPRPFSFATEKRAVASTSSAPWRSDTKIILSSSPLRPKNNNSKVVSSKPGIPHCQKSEKVESKRGHEEVGGKVFAFNRHDTHLKAGGASNVIWPLKARSFDLPDGYKGDAKDGTNSNRFRRKNGDGKRKIVDVANNETCLKEAGGHVKPAIVNSLCRNQNSENIKMASSRIRDLSLNTKKSCLGDHYLVRRKPSLDKPRWR